MKYAEFEINGLTWAGERPCEQDAMYTRQFWRRRLCIEVDAEAFRLVDNVEREPTLAYYPATGAWFYEPWYGEDRRMAGGLQEALANVEIMWTG